MPNCYSRHEIPLMKPQNSNLGLRAAADFTPFLVYGWHVINGEKIGVK